MSALPTIFHITHHKAGSQWIAEVLKWCAPERTVPPKVRIAHFLKDPIISGGIYPTVYVTRQQFEKVWDNSVPHRKFMVIRDLRDTLVSFYFSLKISHSIQIQQQTEPRMVLRSIDKEQGLIYLMDKILRIEANMQLSWIGCEDLLLVRYEDLIRNEFNCFKRVIDYCQIEIAHEKLENIIRDNSFENVTGRKRGTEDELAHQRKGVAGDWRNHFTPRVTEEFKNRFGDVLIQTGYEKNFNW